MRPDSKRGFTVSPASERAIQMAQIRQKAAQEGDAAAKETPSGVRNVPPVADATEEDDGGNTQVTDVSKKLAGRMNAVPDPVSVSKAQAAEKQLEDSK